MDTERKVALITGASQGIGAALVQAYLAKGWNVVANSRSIGPGNGGTLLTVAGDIADKAVAQQLTQTALDAFGRVDSLVNNAGIFIPNAFTDYSEADFRTLIDLNLFGFFHATQAAVRPMLRQGTGHIVNITTSLVSQPMKQVPSALQSLTKGGLNAVTKSLALEYADKGVRVNAVSPGLIKTPMHAPDSHDFLASLHPMGRMGEVADITDAVLYLESAAFVTGEVLHVDGGTHAGRW